MPDTIPNQTITYLPIDNLQVNPLQPRGSIDKEDLEDLTASIKLHGILEPLVVAHTPAGYQIIAGERRWRAAKIAGLKEVPVILRETSPKGMLEMALIENVQRVDLHPLDRAKAFVQLLSDYHLTVGQIANRIGKSQSYVSNTLRLLELPDALKDGLLGGVITEGHARALSAIGDTKLMVDAYKVLMTETGSVRRAEELARRMKQKAGMPPSKGYGNAPHLLSKEIDEWQERLEKLLGEKSRVKLTRSRAQTKVLFVLHGNLNETQPLLEKILAIAKDDVSVTTE